MAGQLLCAGRADCHVGQVEGVYAVLAQPAQLCAGEGNCTCTALLLQLGEKDLLPDIVV